jgi:hypothetical protein
MIAPLQSREIPRCECHGPAVVDVIEITECRLCGGTLQPHPALKIRRAAASLEPRETPDRAFGASLVGSMTKGREPQIILKSDQRNLVLELGLGENTKRNQAAGTRTEFFWKAMFLKLHFR